jgi:hypothetical protein
MLSFKGWQIKAFLFWRKSFMRQVLSILVFALTFVFVINGQNKPSMYEVLQPLSADFAEAQNLGFEVFKILPRGMFDYERNELSLRGGGAYYSFVNKSHSYNEIPQIELQKGYLSVSFYGANYGFIADLGEIPLADIDSKNNYADYLIKYKPKKLEPEAREEYRKLGKGFKISGLKFNQRLAATVGHTYILRAISYDEADTLVAFNVYRQDADGSLTIFWKLVENFEKPLLARN